ncbi:MAG: hypothetical protein HY399_03385 [Elusimicrobia bacterium]|nr:hypothetical protein [Elusimicrobiota bacterium]
MYIRPIRIKLVIFILLAMSLPSTNAKDSDPRTSKVLAREAAAFAAVTDSTPEKPTVPLSHEERNRKFKETWERTPSGGRGQLAIWRCQDIDSTLATFLADKLVTEPSERDRSALAQVLAKCGPSEIAVKALMKSSAFETSDSVRRLAALALQIRREEKLAASIYIDLMKRRYGKGFMHMGSEFHSFRTPEGIRFAAEELKKASQDATLSVDTRIPFILLAGYLDPVQFNDESVKFLTESIGMSERGDKDVEKALQTWSQDLVNMARRHSHSPDLIKRVRQIAQRAAASSIPALAQEGHKSIQDLDKIENEK